jgi:hypothetical protein
LGEYDCPFGGCHWTALKTSFLKTSSSNHQNKLIDCHYFALHFIISLRLPVVALMAKDPASAWLLTEVNAFSC